MAKTRTMSKPSGGKKNRADRRRGKHHRSNGSITTIDQSANPDQLYLRASELFCELQVDEALSLAQRALRCIRSTYPDDPAAACPALLLLGQIYLAQGDIEASREHYLEATKADTDGGKVGAAPFLWSAQLSEEGGEDSIRWFERACAILRKEINDLEGGDHKGEAREEINKSDIEKTRRQLGEALCSMTEIYMTDLSFDPHAGSKCDALITEALLISPESPAVLQTLASVRISEERTDDAKAALSRSMGLWQNLPADDADYPDFATRISLTRLLLEVQMEAEAIKVVDRLVQEDDESVEAWYLGAWSRSLQFEQGADTATDAREWFRRSLQLYVSVGYEDEKLRSHVMEMITKLDSVLGEPINDDTDDNEDDDEDGEWQDEEVLEVEPEEEQSEEGGGRPRLNDDHEDINMN